MSVFIRTTFEPFEVIEVSDAEYRGLLSRGLVYAVEGEPPLPTPIFTPAQEEALEDFRQQSAVLVAQAQAAAASAAADKEAAQTAAGQATAPTDTMVATKVADRASLTGAAITKRLAVFDVRDYGAKGDGVTDDYAAVAAAITAWRQASVGPNGAQPGQLLFPSGYRFAVSQPVTIAPPSSGDLTGGSIYGYGAELYGLTPMEYVLKIDSTGSGRYWRNWSYVGLSIRNGGLLIRSSSNLSDNVYGWSIVDPTIFSTGLGHGIFIDSAYEGAINNPRVSHSGAGEFSAIAVLGNASSVQLFGGITRRGKYGVYSDGTDLQIFGTTTLEAQLEGIRMGNGRGGVINGAHVERCQASRTSLGTNAPGIYIEGAVTVSGAYVYDTTVVAERRTTHAVSAFATVTGSPFIVGVYSANIPTHVRANGNANSTITILGALSYELVTTAISVMRLGGGASGGAPAGFLSEGMAVDIRRASGTDALLRGRDTSTTDRFAINALGAMSWAGFGTAADVSLSRPAADLLAMAAGDSFRVDGTWNGGKLRLGTYNIWVDATGALRIKNGTPTSDTDGTLV